MGWTSRLVAGSTAVILVLTCTISQADPLRPEQLPAEEMNQLKWAISPTGTRQAGVLGDPTKTGMYVVRSSFPSGFRTSPHLHPDERILTVLSGTVYVGYGEQFDETKMKAMSPGSVWTEPARQAHFTWAKDGEALIQ